MTSELRLLLRHHFSRTGTTAALISSTVVFCNILFVASYPSVAAHVALAVAWGTSVMTLAQTAPPKALRYLPISAGDLARFQWLTRIGLAAVALLSASIIGLAVGALISSAHIDATLAALYLLCLLGSLGLYTLAVTISAARKSSEEPLVQSMTSAFYSAAIGAFCLWQWKHNSSLLWLSALAIGIGLFALIFFSLRPVALLPWPTTSITNGDIADQLFKGDEPNHPLKRYRYVSIDGRPSTFIFVIGTASVGMGLAALRHAYGDERLGVELFFGPMLLSRFMVRRYGQPSLRALRALPISIHRLTARILLSGALPQVALVVAYVATHVLLGGNVSIGFALLSLSGAIAFPSILQFEFVKQQSLKLYLAGVAAYILALAILFFALPSGLPAVNIVTGIALLMYSYWHTHHSLNSSLASYRDRAFSGRKPGSSDE